jgi:serine/threonine protein kinase
MKKVPLRVFLNGVLLAPVKPVRLTMKLSAIPDLYERDEPSFEFYNSEQDLLDPTTTVEGLGSPLDVYINADEDDDETTTPEQWTEQETECSDDETANNLQRTALIQKSCAFPSIQAVGDISVEQFESGSVFKMSVENAELPTLDTIGDLSPPSAHVVLLGIAYALRHMHALGIVHLDICLENVLLTRDRKPILTGFDYAFYVRDGPSILPAPGAQSAPELAKGGGIGPAVDVFDFGFFMRRYNSDGRYESLITKCVSPNPADRPSAAAIVQSLTGPEHEKILSHPIVANYLAELREQEPALSLKEFDLSALESVCQFEPLTTLFEEKRTKSKCVLKCIPVASEAQIKELEKLAPSTCPSVVRYCGINVHRTLRTLVVFLQRPFYPKDLQQAMNEPNAFDLTGKFILVFGIAKGLEYLAASDIAHGNLRPSNVLLDSENAPILVGCPLSPTLRLKGPPSERGKTESILYCAPEVLKNGAIADGAGDIYALGMVMYSLFDGGEFASQPETKLKFELTFGKRPALAYPVPQPFRLLIARCWKDIPEARPSVTEVLAQLQHPSFLDLVDKVRIKRYMDRFD